VAISPRAAVASGASAIRPNGSTPIASPTEAASAITAAAIRRPIDGRDERVITDVERIVEGMPKLPGRGKGGAIGPPAPRRRVPASCSGRRVEIPAPFPPCGPETPHLYTPAKHVVTGFPEGRRARNPKRRDPLDERVHLGAVSGNARAETPDRGSDGLPKGEASWVR